MSPSRKSDKPRRLCGSHVSDRHGAKPPAAAQPPPPPPRATIEHALPPVERIGAIAWLPRAARRDEERAA